MVGTYKSKILLTLIKLITIDGNLLPCLLILGIVVVIVVFSFCVGCSLCVSFVYCVSFDRCVILYDVCYLCCVLL
jgi:hypothetical protein